MMEEIEITQEHRDFVAHYAPGRDLGGFSNLNKNDLQKSSRLDFQYTGLYGELAWYLYRYGNTSKLAKILDHKEKTLTPAMKGDDGFDDVISHNGTTRLIDIKSSHVSNEDWIEKLNLVIPPREYHKNMIYICGFSVGPNRRDVSKVILSGWCANEHVTEKWDKDPAKFAVKVSNLKSLTALKKIL